MWKHKIVCASKISTAIAVLALGPAALSQENSSHHPPPFVNQAGYNLGEAKRFTLPETTDGTQFQIVRIQDGAVLYEGEIMQEAGDFSDFNPVSADDEYVIRTRVNGSSVPFRIADHLMEAISSQLAYQFFIDVRGGFTPEVTPRNVTGGGPSKDGGGATLETTFEILLYASNPGLFDRWRNELRYHTQWDDRMYTVYRPELEPEYAQNAPRGEASIRRHHYPDLIKLILWHAKWALNFVDYTGSTSHGFEAADNYADVRTFGYDDNNMQEFDKENLLDHLAAVHAAYSPFLHDYMTPEVHREIRQVLFDRWEKYDRHKEVRYWVVSGKWIDEGRNEFNEMGSAFGQGLLRNLLMYIGERNMQDGDPDRFAGYVRACAQDIIDNWDLDNEWHMWAMRNAEHITPQALALLYIAAPEIAPAGTKAKLEAYRDYIVKRTDNLWQYRTHSDTEWAHRRSKEVGTVAGLGGSMFAVAEALHDDELRGLGWSQVNFVFGQNPAGAHLSHKSFARVALGGYWAGVENGWPSTYPHGSGELGLVRGALDGSPTNDAFPYVPEYAALADGASPTHGEEIYATEGWAPTNRAWMSTVSLSTLGSQGVRFLDESGNEIDSADPGDMVQVELRAALNLNSKLSETGYVLLENAPETPRKIEVTETGPNTGMFTADIKILNDAPVTASYGFLMFRKSATLN